MVLFGRSKKAEAEAEAEAAAASYSGNDSMSEDSPPAYDDDAPPYTTQPSNDAAAAAVASSSSTSQCKGFVTTSQLQIQAIGYDYTTALCGMNHEQISVYRPGTGAHEYTSVRPSRKSNSCALVPSAAANDAPVNATVYRWGPGRPPRIKLLPKDGATTVEDAIQSDEAMPLSGEILQVRSRNMLSRAQNIETSFGTFEWRYGDRHERKAAHGASSLLILEKVESGILKSSKKKTTRVAQLVRNDQYRTPGTTRHMGGNGGRLMMDLRPWADDKNVTTKDMEEFAVAGCICMLKREADRFINNAVATVT